MLNFLATPYTKHPSGLDAAFQEACFTASMLRHFEYRVFCPIEAGHKLAEQTGVDPLDWKFWIECYAPWIAKCDRLLVAKMDGWEESVGVQHERAEFRQLGKPELLIDPFTLSPL